ncbi:MAG: hypothetical protein NWF03_09055 [Candidatus Bathyarchaeota archaeon]|nr:hypothetical protein [Candidatus Bathyarchaeota archaeon]
MRKLLKNKKALSPVVAAIILIAVTVAVSIAVAAWMGSLTFTFMETEELKISTGTLNATAQSASLFIVNSGTVDITVEAITVTGAGHTGTVTLTANNVIDAGGSATITATGYTAGTLVAGNSYNVEVVTSKGNVFTYKANAIA